LKQPSAFSSLLSVRTWIFEQQQLPPRQKLDALEAQKTDDWCAASSAVYLSRTAVQEGNQSIQL
jgi:hypothetical protein